MTAHITMLQSIITRLANNSASCKTWCLTLVGAVLSFAAGIRSPQLATFTIVPIVLFALLDTIYLAEERAFRALFNKIAGKVRDGSYRIADSFDTAVVPVRPGEIARAIGSWSIWPIYLTLLIAYGVAALNGWGIPAAQPVPATPTPAAALRPAPVPLPMGSMQ